MEITAQLKGLRIAPRKVRLVSGILKGRDAMKAKSQLEHLAKRSARPLVKLLDSALANAHHNLGLVKENLFIKDIIVNEGPKLKRFRPKGFGTTSPIEKKTSHIEIVLAERVPGLKVVPEKKREIPEETRPEAEVERETAAVLEKKPQFARKEEPRTIRKKGLFGGIKGLGRRFFRRKTMA